MCCAVAQQEYQPHMLDAAQSPLVRALPDYERQFRHHLAHARAVHENCRVSTCHEIHRHIPAEQPGADVLHDALE